MDRLTLRKLLERPLIRIAVALAAVAVVGFGAIHFWALAEVGKLRTALAEQPTPRTPLPEIRAEDGFVPLVDASLRFHLRNPDRLVYESWSAPVPVDIAEFRGWAVRLSYRVEDPASPCCREGVRVAVLGDGIVDAIVTEEDFLAYTGLAPGVFDAAGAPEAGAP